uniref:Histone deacetylase domain protein n=1 Tax=Marseillevirus LCMAC103 TaxID=2506604 RepID=A0A481YV24_9VIRU|nr:MAG: histone deacetylase domain protein [Marseillevirus LCMAC103]
MASRHPPKIGFIFCPNALHRLDGHPEQPGRVSCARKYLRARFPDIPAFEMAPYSDGEVVAFILDPSRGRKPPVYGRAHLEMVRAGFSEREMHSAYSVGEPSYRACLDVCRCLMTMCGLVRRGVIDHAVNVVRPPGHHCCNKRPAGFCLVNLAVLAAHALLASYGKIPIYDYDLHHGDGTQRHTYNDPDIMYVSQHNKNAWKGDFSIGYEGEWGGPDAPLTNVNFPMPGQSCDRDYLWTGLALCDLMARFASRGGVRSPLVVVSAGFDAHRREMAVAGGDRTKSMRLTSTGYGQLAKLLVGRFERVFLVLEGGYDETAIAESLAETVDALLGNVKPIVIDTSEVHGDAKRLVDNLARAERRRGPPD